MGILIDSTLSWKYHINELGKKLSRVIGIMYKLRHFVSRELMVSLYYSLIYPYLIYGVPIWGTANTTTLSTLHIIQKQIVRLITFNDGYTLIPGPLLHTPPSTLILAPNNDKKNPHVVLCQLNSLFGPPICY